MTVCEVFMSIPQDSQLKFTPVVRAGFRSILFMGADRNILITLAIGCFLAAFLYQFKPIADIVCFVIWLIGLKVAQRIALFDEKYGAVFLRAQGYKWKYPALAYAGKQTTLKERLKSNWSKV
jgi:type IV secretory pathway TrbD component